MPQFSMEPGWMTRLSGVSGLVSVRFVITYEPDMTCDDGSIIINRVEYHWLDADKKVIRKQVLDIEQVRFG